ncbi:methyl-accepting chemotaxis protein [Texcoconibacillus texcoconensis]|uniref:Methyl-accepting chemotaxis protein n=1 Tax=Texcoconibacillus texcoconensis TaxID=1095777 RepID=A0A840QUK6_9BACI|nr:methyl-accepting chemotaxis protein [Texcoconibacillus texcoconensis]MBB5175044.1 methyl-accepting chemotaxis protein [Texcoconibacillus texcoconensis]
MRNIINKLKFGTKLNLLAVTILLSFAIVLGFVAQKQVTEGLEEATLDKTVSDLSFAYHYIDERYHGEWHTEDGALYKGETKINKNDHFVDEIGEMSEGTVSIFLDDIRVSTTIIEDGDRLTGTQAPDNVIESVLHENETFIGETDVLGQNYLGAYRPLENENGDTIGILTLATSQEIVNETITQTMQGLLIVLIIVIVVAVVSVILFSRKTAVRLENISEAMEKAGEGDFTETVQDDNQDEIGQLVNSYNNMKNNLKGLIQKVADTSQQVAASSEQLNASSEETTRATDEISRSIQEVSGGAEKAVESTEYSKGMVSEISTGIEQIANNVQEVSESSLQSYEKASQGEKVIDKTVNQMNMIHEKTDSTSQLVDQLGKKSEKIGDIVSLITGISEQTNLLALNAAIEAARAGEHGKGFAVVADEVRKLAEQSAESSQQISEMIEEIQSDIDNAVHSMGEGRSAVKEGISFVYQAGDSFKDITTVISNVTSQVQEVSAAAQQINVSSQSMVTSIDDTTKVAQSSAEHTQNVAASTEEQNASMQEITAASHSLARMAQDLQESVKTFKL